MEWTEVKTPDDARSLMDVFGNFHDSCIREAHLSTDHWVSRDLSMSCAGHLDNKIRFLIQRQFRNPSAIELFFDHVTRFNLVPAPNGHDAVIFAATLLVQEGYIFWSPEDDWRQEKPNRDEFTWVSAKKLRWREVNWLGEKLHYGQDEAEKADVTGITDE
jgi:hypothetical protein